MQAIQKSTRRTMAELILVELDQLVGHGDISLRGRRDRRKDIALADVSLGARTPQLLHFGPQSAAA